MELKKSKFGMYLDGLEKVFTAIVTVIYIAMIAVVFLQVFARLFLPQVPAWTEEASRYLQVYLVAFSAGLAVKYDCFVRVDTIFGLIKPKAGRVLKIINELFVIILFAYCLRYSFDMYELGKPRSAVSMTNLKMNYVYFSMVLASFLALCSTVFKTVKMIISFKGGEE